jgi:hypothetical protein
MALTETRVRAVNTLTPKVRNAAATGATIDTQGYMSVGFVVSVDAITDGTHTVKVQESDDGTSWSDVDPSQLDGAFVALTANSVQYAFYTGYKRYVRGASSSTGTTGAGFSMIGLLGRPNHAGSM